MPKVIVDGIEVEIGANERLNGIQAAARAGVQIPHYCWHAGLSVVASCRMCLVEAGKKDAATGQIQMQPKVVPACQTPATDGTVFVTTSDKVKAAREMVEEDLLLRHPVDCPICDKAGECSLQDYHFQHGREERRADIKPFHSRRRDLGDTVTLFVDRCVVCTRCVRFTREVTGTAELMVANRGSHEEIDVFPGFPLENKLSGCVVDLCPVGALGDKDFLYEQRVWFMKSHEHVCAGCSTGCSIKIDENQDHIYRLKPRENPHVNQWWMCDEGRYGWKHVHDPQRANGAKRRDGENWVNVEWQDVPAELRRQLQGRRLAVAVSPHLTVEEAYLLAQFARSVDPQAVLGLGPVPTQGEDESFRNGFVIRAEKCPNRRGVEEVLRHVQGEVLSWSDWLARLDDASCDAVWVGGVALRNPVTEADVAKLSGRAALIVQDLFDSPLWGQATLQLPGAAFAERDGSFVNARNRLQSFRWAVRAPGGTMPEGQLFWRLLERQGLYRSAVVLAEIAAAVPFFSAAGQGVPEHGVELKVPELAATT